MSTSTPAPPTNRPLEREAGSRAPGTCISLKSTNGGGSTPQHASARVRPAAATRHARGFWIVAAIFAVTIAFAAAPAPLYVIYQQEQGFGAFAVTLIFAAYALGVALSLYLAGHVSDVFGRRRIIVPAVLLNLVAALVFLVQHDLGWLLAARFVSGLGVGMLTATATAYLTDLHRTARPGAAPTLAAAVGTAANIGGIGLGPLVGGLLAQYLPAPLTITYLVFAIAMTLGLVALVAVPETVSPPATPWRYRPQRVAVPPQVRLDFWSAGMVAFVAFAMFGFFTSLAPSFLAGTLHQTSHAVAGLVTFGVFGTAAVAQILTGGWTTARLYRVGLPALPVGLGLLLAALLAGSFPLLVGAGVIVGIGAGIGFRAAVGTVITIAPAGSRGEALAGLFLVAYLGLSLPVLLLGVLLQLAPMDPAMIAFGVLMLGLLAVAVVLLRAGGRRRDRLAVA